MTRNGFLNTITAIATLGTVTGCGYAGSQGAPLRLEERRAAVPPPGLCAVWDGDRRTAYRPQSCDGIEYSAPLGAQILYRPDDGTRHVAVCFLSRTEPREIIAIDLYHVDNGRLIRTVQSTNDYPRGTSCQVSFRTRPR